MDGARPSSGAAATSRGPEGNRHPDGSAESRAHDARTLSTMDGTLRDSCERIRDRVAELAGDARPRVVSEMEAALSQVEYDLNGAEFLLAQLKEALAVSAPLASDSAPPVAASPLPPLSAPTPVPPPAVRFADLRNPQNVSL